MANVRYRVKARPSALVSKPCVHCASTEHTNFYCYKKPRKAIVPKIHCTFCDKYGHLKRDCPTRLDPSKPLPSGKYPPIKKYQNQYTKYNVKWMYTRKAWLSENKPNHAGYYVCHYCGKHILLNEMTIDHKEARSRHPELRYEQSNLVPACWTCNGLKASMSHDEYDHICHT